MNSTRSETPLSSSQWLPLADVLLVLVASSTLLIPLHQWFSKPSKAPVLSVEILGPAQLSIQGRSIPLDRLAAVATAYSAREPEGRLRLKPMSSVRWGELRPVFRALSSTPSSIELKLPDAR